MSTHRTDGTGTQDQAAEARATPDATRIRKLVPGMTVDVISATFRSPATCNAQSR
jgi:hypothetical protein